MANILRRRLFMAKHRLTLAETRWRRVVAEFRGSGETAVDFCTKRSINIGTFYVWCSKLRKIDQALEAIGEPLPPPALVPVELIDEESEPDPEPIEIHLVGGDMIRVPLNADMSQVEDIVAILRREWE